MVFRAVTDRQDWLVRTIILPIENDAKKMESLARSLAASKAARFPAAAFRQRVRRNVERDFFDSQGWHIGTDDLHFCLMWLWHNTLGQSFDGYMHSNNHPTSVTLASIYKQCVSSESQPESQPTEEIPMPTISPASFTVAFETKHFVFGQNIDSLTESDLINAVKMVENEITDLKSVKTKSTRITAKVKELEDMLAEIVKVLDAQ